MLCKRPFMAGAVPFGCGQCLPCRINKRRMWMWRQFFESLLHEENCFVTLTYSDETLPVDGCLRPGDLQLWLKRLRKAVYPKRVRFFAVGEYGDATGRPHYHASLFGVSGHTVVGNKLVSKIIEETWKLGHVMVAEFNEATAQYVAGYTTKKLTFAGDPRLKGKTPEFMRSSRRPGLGADAMRVIALQLSEGGHLRNGEDVPRQLKLGRKNIPLGRYLLEKLRREVGMDDEAIKRVKDAIAFDRSLEMQALFKVHGELEEVPTFRKAHVAEVAQRVLQAEKRYEIWSKKRGSL